MEGLSCVHHSVRYSTLNYLTALLHFGSKGTADGITGHNETLEDVLGSAVSGQGYSTSGELLARLVNLRYFKIRIIPGRRRALPPRVHGDGHAGDHVDRHHRRHLRAVHQPARRHVPAAQGAVRDGHGRRAVPLAGRHQPEDEDPAAGDGR